MAALVELHRLTSDNSRRAAADQVCGDGGAVTVDDRRRGRDRDRRRVAAVYVDVVDVPAEAAERVVGADPPAELHALTSEGRQVHPARGPAVAGPDESVPPC